MKTLANVGLTILGLCMIPIWLLIVVAALGTVAVCWFVEDFIFGEKYDSARF